ncbi:MAG: serine/threonine-protein phosphatase [Lewinellaceae bacterium]|nr:serine/threonine-protein phosphatase [Lewinellaceae bacterium]
MWSIKHKMFSETGPRLRNEDFIKIELIEEDFIVAAIADGIGSFEDSDKASEVAVESYIDIMTKNDVIDYRSVLNDIESKVKSVNKNERSGTTLSGIRLKGNRLSLLHIGDSRIYIKRENHNIRQITSDHVLPSGSSRKSNVLTNYVGKIDQANVQINQIEIEESFILFLCTDGFYNVINEFTLNIILAKFASVENIYRQLKKEVALRTLRDNCTFGIIYAHNTGSTPLS